MEIQGDIYVSLYVECQLHMSEFNHMHDESMNITKTPQIKCN
jgi:hypothetical protein